MQISKEQLSHYITFAVLLANLFDVNISDTEIESILIATAGLVATLVAIYKRYKRGDITKLGFKKN